MRFTLDCRQANRGRSWRTADKPSNLLPSGFAGARTYTAAVTADLPLGSVDKGLVIDLSQMKDVRSPRLRLSYDKWFGFVSVCRCSS